MRRGAVVVALFASGVLLAAAGARELVEVQSRGFAALLGTGSAFLFFSASFFGSQMVAGAYRFWAVLHWLGMWVLATVAMLVFGYFAIRWVQHDSVAVRLFAVLGVAVLAGGSLVLPQLISAITVSRLLGLAAAIARWSARGTSYVAPLTVQEGAWRPPPGTRLAALLVRCIVMHDRCRCRLPSTFRPSTSRRSWRTSTGMRPWAWCCLGRCLARCSP